MDYHWVEIGLGALGFIGTWVLGAFKLGRAVEQVKSSVKDQIETERDKIIAKVEEMEKEFRSDQQAQDHNFGEVGASLRQYVANVEQRVRDVEIYGRDNYVKIPDFKESIERLTVEIKNLGNDIKKDIRQLLRNPS